MSDTLTASSLRTTHQYSLQRSRGNTKHHRNLIGIGEASRGQCRSAILNITGTKQVQSLSLEELSVPIVREPNGGILAGGYFLPINTDAVNQTRATSRVSYLDRWSWRPNLNVLTNHQVTRILFSNFSTTGSGTQTGGGNPSATGNSTIVLPNLFGNPAPPTLSKPVVKPRQTSTSALHATAVEIASFASAPRQTIFARREVIMAAGAIHSPQILQLSGIGPGDVLRRFNISVGVDLSGVGRNLQDHSRVTTTYSYQNTSYPNPLNALGAAAQAEYRANKTGPCTAEPSSALAFLSLPMVANDSSAILASAAASDPSLLPQSYDATLHAGYAQQLSALTAHLAGRQTPAFELLNDNSGIWTMSLMHPFSRGVTEIVSANPFDPPMIDPRYLVNPTDMEIYVRAIQFNQRILDTTPMQVLQPSFSTPVRNATEEQIRDLLRAGLQTMYHPTGTCAMLDRALGGVVNPRLVVYGTDNVRVVDTSMQPLIPNAHLQAAVYAVAEKASDLIKQDAGDPMGEMPGAETDAQMRAWAQWQASINGAPGGVDRGRAEP
ncbi:MAG: hypothetical protein Q9227_005815 [Pyrenula ochraceoflavens]